MKNSKLMKGFIDFHSFAQLWMSPWGYTKKLPPDFKDQVRFQRLNKPFEKLICCLDQQILNLKKKASHCYVQQKNVNNQDIKQTIIVLVAPGV